MDIYLPTYLVVSGQAGLFSFCTGKKKKGVRHKRRHADCNKVFPHAEVTQRKGRVRGPVSTQRSHPVRLSLQLFIASSCRLMDTIPKHLMCLFFDANVFSQCHKKKKNNYPPSPRFVAPVQTVKINWMSRTFVLLRSVCRWQSEDESTYQRGFFFFFFFLPLHFTALGEIRIWPLSEASARMSWVHLDSYRVDQPDYYRTSKNMLLQQT